MGLSSQHSVVAKCDQVASLTPTCCVRPQPQDQRPGGGVEVFFIFHLHSEDPKSRIGHFEVYVVGIRVAVTLIRCAAPRDELVKVNKTLTSRRRLK